MCLSVLTPYMESVVTNSIRQKTYLNTNRKEKAVLRRGVGGGCPEVLH